MMPLGKARTCPSCTTRASAQCLVSCKRLVPERAGGGGKTYRLDMVVQLFPLFLLLRCSRIHYLMAAASSRR